MPLSQQINIRKVLQTISTVAYTGNTVMILKFQTNRFGQTGQTQIRLLLKDATSQSSDKCSTTLLSVIHVFNIGFNKIKNSSNPLNGCTHWFEFESRHEKPTFWFSTWSDTNQAVQLQKMDRGLKFQIKKVEGSYYLCSENKGADQRRGHREADLRLSFRICKMLVFS